VVNGHVTAVLKEGDRCVRVWVLLIHDDRSHSVPTLFKRDRLSQQPANAPACYCY